MAISYRGKNVDMISLARKNEETVALGNAHMNGRGDILGKGGKVVKSREDQLAEYYEGNTLVNKSVNLKNESVKEVESELKEIQEVTTSKSRSTKKPVYQDITEEEKKELKKDK